MNIFSAWWRYPKRHHKSRPSLRVLWRAFHGVYIYPLWFRLWDSDVQRLRRMRLRRRLSR